MEVNTAEPVVSAISDRFEQLSKWQLGRLSPMPSCLPRGWELVRLTSVARLESGHTPSRRHSEYWDGGIPWVSLHDTAGLDVPEIQSTAQTISTLGLEHSSARILPKGTVVFSRTATVGKSTVIGRDMATSQDFANYVCGSRLHNRYLVHLFRFMEPEWQRLMAGSTHNSIYMPVFQDLQILLPPIEEQSAIAEALSDADALIESLERLVAKKRQLKQGAMQELLTGKKRLPGFRTGWAHVHLRDLLSYERPDRYIVRDSEYSERGDTPVLTANKSFVLGYTAETSGICRDLPTIVFDDFTTASKYVDFSFKVKSSAIKLLRPKHDQVDLRFVYDRMQLIRFPLGDHKRYYISEFQNIELAIPDHAEQQTIATTLGDMDAEIAALEAKVAKARQLKQGMMQELLTGRIRLV